MENDFHGTQLAFVVNFLPVSIQCLFGLVVPE